MTTNILFLCPHSAGKSLLAATYFRAAADRHGLDVSIDVAGPDPDDVNIPRVTAALERQGHTIGWNPRLVKASDTEKADLIVSIGCDHAAIPTDDATGTTLQEWDVPMLSVDFDAAVLAIHGRAEALASQLGTA